MNSRYSWKITFGFLLSITTFVLFAIPASSAQNAPPANSQVSQDSQMGPDAQISQSGQMGQEPQMAQDDTADPPSRVARISFLDGTVSIQPGGTGDWGSASINRPVTIGDKLWTDQNSKLELEAGQASIHLSAMTALSFLNLDENATQMRLAEGRINFRVREIREGDLYEVDTPNLAFTVRQAGAFRIDVNENGDTTAVTVIRGEGEVAAGGQTYTVHAGERASIAGADNNVKYEVHGAPLDPDEFDTWAQQRDLREENSTSAKYVSREVVGYSDLDDYGAWKEEPTYGNVWYPNNVSGDWAPYSNGNWSWVAPWGWTWNDYAPWGFAPFHYGRWIYGSGRWGWCPGPIYARPYYGPAFVGFLGGGGFGFGIGIGFGVGWFPLGWGEAYHPWYHAGGRYWNNINVHNTYIHNVNTINRTNNNYAYAHNTRAVTVASHNSFVNGQAINRGASHVSDATLRGTHVTGAVNATPTHTSYLGAAGNRGRVATPSNNVQNRPVVARTAPAASASHLPVRTMNSAALTPGRTSSLAANPSRGFGQSSNYSRPASSGNQASTLNRQAQISSNRPPSAMTQVGRTGSYSNNVGRQTIAPARAWGAQGNATDYGRAPQGFGGNRPTGEVRTTQMNQNSRPPWVAGNASGSSNGNSRAGSYGQAAPRNSGNRPPAYSNESRGASSPRGYSAPRSYNPPPASRGSSAPRSYSAPHSSSGGSSHGGGGSPHSSGGGGSSHGGGGGGGSHGHR
jgi:FecR protein